MKEKSSSLGLKRSKYTTWVLSIVLFFILVASVPAGVVYASSLDTMVPSDTNTDANYNRYGVSHYSFQTLSEDHHFWQVGAVAKDGIVGAYDSILSATFLAIVQITRFFNFVSREAFTFSMMDALIDGIAEIIRQVTGVNTGFITSGGLFDSLGGIAVMITAAYILWLMVKTRFLDGMQQAFSFLIALIVIIGFFANAGPMLKGANNAVSSVGTVIYSALAKATGLSTNSANGVVIISEQVWNELVIRPYTMLQFDSSDLATKDPVLLDQVLKSQPFSDERQAVLASAASKYPAVGQVRSSEQMIMILVFFIFSAIILGLFTYWAILTIFMRFKLLSHAAVMSVTLIGALLPGREAGVAVLRSQFTKLIGYVVMTAMTMFMLDLSLVMGHFTYDVVFKVGKGWFLALFLESIMIFVIFKYRNEITQVFGKATGIPSNLPRPKSTVADALQRNVTRTLYNTAANKVGGLFNRRGREGVPASFSPSALSRAHNSLNDATSASMMLRYQREREAAESMATEEGQEVQHTPFVQRVNENLRNGAKNPFRGMDKEWKEEQQRLKNVQDDKGNMKEAILTQGIVDGMNDQEAAAVIYGNEHAIRKAATYMVERPKRVGEQMARAKSLNRDHQLKTSVDDFCMIQLFDRYKVDYKQAVEASHVSGDPVKHSDFVKNMDARFGEAGLNNTTKVNNTMLHRNSRISIAPMFEDMPEFQQVKMKLLHANEALRRISPPTEGVELPLPVHLTAPISTQHLLSQMPKVSSGDIVSQMHERSAAIRQSLIPTQVTPIVNMPESYLRKPAARLENDIKNVAPLASIQQLPLSTEHVKASLPRLPKNTIAGQIEKQRRELHEQLVQSLPVQDTSAQLIPSPRVAITGLIHPKVIQLPKLSSGGIRQQLMDQKNSIVRQAFQESRLSVDAIQQRGKHMFPTQKKPSQQHLGSRSTIQNETS
ncbi:CD3337/EF1877 family mobilome membrane protein, partial [Paenibacillus sonchi]